MCTKQPPGVGRRLFALSLVTVAVAMVIGAAGEPANNYQFAIVGDRTGGNHPGIYPRVWRDIQLLAPDFAINVGDTIQGYIRDENILVAEANRQWDEVYQTLDRYADVRYYLTPGNHDIWSKSAEAVYVERAGHPTHYSFVYQESGFIVLDNSRDETLNDQQYAFLEQELARLRDRQPLFVFFHRPFWITPVRGGDDTFRLHQLCRQYGVDWVITGHGHQLVYLPFDGVHYLEVGSSGGGIGLTEDKQPRLQFDNGRFFHHVIARVRGGEVRMTVKEVGGAAGEGRIFDLARWRGSGPGWAPADDPFAGEQGGGELLFLQPTQSEPLPRGIVPIVALDTAVAERPLTLTIQDQPVTVNPAGYVGLAFQVYDLHSVELIDQVYVNGQHLARMSPRANLVSPWTWLGYGVPRARWEAQTPPVVRLTAGTRTDGTGANPADNNDDYGFREVFAYDGERYLRDPKLAPGLDRWLGDNGQHTETLADLTLSLPDDNPAGRLLVHAWDTTDLLAGTYTLKLSDGQREVTCPVTLP